MDRDELEAQQLGELPLIRSRERGEVYTHERDAPLYGEPGARVTVPRPIDVALQNRAQRQSARAPAAHVPVEYLVQTSYDGRPVNGLDFQFSRGTGVMTLVADPQVTRAVISTFVVPSGKVAVLRRWRWWPSITLANSNFAPEVTDLREIEPLFWTLRVNGIILPEYNRIPQQSGEREVYAIAGEGQLIEAIAQLNTDIIPGPTVPNDYEVRLFTILYGNLLQSTGRPFNFEPVNEYQAGGNLK